MNWLRWYTGSATDPKFVAIAKRTGQNVAAVLAVWVMLLERGCEADTRGDVDGFDCEGADVVLGLPDGAACAIVNALEARGLLTGGRVTDWHKIKAPDVCRILDVSTKEWERLRSIVFERDNYTCQYCGKRGVALECDHIFPFSRGGVSSLDNLVTSCKPCNRSKGSKTLDEWRRWHQ